MGCSSLVLFEVVEEALRFEARLMMTGYEEGEKKVRRRFNSSLLKEPGWAEFAASDDPLFLFLSQWCLVSFVRAVSFPK